ncbi:MAG: sterol desaturase family protein [Deltaproteobacteria bacterium]|nr:sterol desaturase family protein [Deltaproteobacteria bacterium]
MWLNGALVFGALGALLLLERRRPLRRMTQDKTRRDVRNLAIAALAGATVAIAQAPVIGPLTRFVERRRIGLLKVARLPEPIESLLAIVLMDYTLWVWHYLTHRVPFLWRFHEAHHVDLDLDATTALRFHFGEMLLSLPWRAAQVALFGVSPRAFSIWQTATTVQILFHHSNVRLPERLERFLCHVIVTPRMHGIHHSIVKGETDSNWSTIFSFPDRLHGTLRLNVPQSAITIGVPAYGGDLTLGEALGLPFRRVLWRWTRPEQPAPTREPQPLPSTALAV